MYEYALFGIIKFVWLTIEATTNYCLYYGCFLLKLCRSPITNQEARDQQAMHLVRALQLFLEHQNRVTWWTTPWGRRGFAGLPTPLLKFSVYQTHSLLCAWNFRLIHFWPWSRQCLANFGFPNQFRPLIVPAVDFAPEQETSRKITLVGRNQQREEHDLLSWSVSWLISSGPLIRRTCLVGNRWLISTNWLVTSIWLVG